MLQDRLSVEPRTGTGKGSARALRRSEMIPAIVYGHGFDPVPLKVKLSEIKRLLHHETIESVILKTQINGVEENLIVKSIQRHPLTHDILHIDFQRIKLTEKITTHVPIELQGEPIGVKQDGGVLDFLLREVEVRCLPTEIPEHITVDVSELKIGDSLRIGDLQLPDNIEVLTDPETPFVVIAAPTVVEVTAEEEAEEGEGEELEEAEETAEDAEETE